MFEKFIVEKVMVEKLMVEKHMVDNFMVKEYGVEAWGLNVLQLSLNLNSKSETMDVTHLPKSNLHSYHKLSLSICQGTKLCQNAPL